MRVAALLLLLSVCLVYGEPSSPQAEPPKRSNLVVSSTTSQLPFYLRQEPIFEGPQDRNPKITWQPLRRDIYPQLRLLGETERREVRAIRYIMDEDLDKNREWAIGLLILLEIPNSRGFYTPIYFASDSQGKTEDYDVSGVVDSDIGPALMIKRQPQYGLTEWQVLTTSPGGKTCKVADLFIPADSLAPLIGDGWYRYDAPSKIREPRDPEFDPATFTRKYTVHRKQDTEKGIESATAVVKYRWKNGQLIPEKPELVPEL